jgi:hypothetical protein
MRDVKALYERLRATPWPALAGSIEDFPLYESLLAGCADQVVKGYPLDISKVPTPDHKTVAQVAMLRKKGDKSQEEMAFLDYFDLLEEIRLALAGGTRRY